MIIGRQPKLFISGLASGFVINTVGFSFISWEFWLLLTVCTVIPLNIVNSSIGEKN